MPHDMWDPSSPTRNQTRAPAVEAWSVNPGLPGKPLIFNTYYGSGSLPTLYTARAGVLNKTDHGSFLEAVNTQRQPAVDCNCDFFSLCNETLHFRESWLG